MRYYSRGYVEDNLFEDDRQPMIPGIGVCDHEATFTGLLDASGQPIMKQPRPIGFGRDNEW